MLANLQWPANGDADLERNPDNLGSNILIKKPGAIGSMRCNRFWFLGLFVVVLCTTGCASGLKHYERTSSTSLDDPESTTAGQLFTEEQKAHPGKSGFALLTNSETAFRARNGAAAIAEKTIDAQYYIWESDTTGLILVDRLIRAADRGVRVRLLVDDFGTAGRDFDIAMMDAHPNIEIRLFNPFANRGFRGIEFLTDLSRVNHRMHNKSFIVDNAIAVVGGRNIGDHYFGVDTVNNFRDLDLLAVGPIVRGVSASFDTFWNSEWAVPTAAIAATNSSAEERTKLKKEFQEWAIKAQGQYPYVTSRHRRERIADLEKVRDRFVWTDAEVLFDDPSKALGTEHQGIAPRLWGIVEKMKEELLIESAYFVPGEIGVRALRDLRMRGVRVRILTNSLASNDVVAAFSGYSKYRKALLKNGVELHELQADFETARKHWSILAARSRASLHTKVLVFDREHVFIGSMNLDPRSSRINTEIGILVHSPELAAQVAAFMDEGAQLDNSYKLAVVADPDHDGAALAWIGEEEGQEVLQMSEPDTGFGRQFSVFLMALLPIEEQL